MNIEDQQTILKQMASAVEELDGIEDRLSRILKTISTAADNLQQNDWELFNLLKGVLANLETVQQGTHGALDGFRKIGELVMSRPASISFPSRPSPA